MELGKTGIDYIPVNLEVATRDGFPDPGRELIRQLSPKFQLFVVLEGKQRFTIDNVVFDIQAQNAPKALLLCLRQESTLRLQHIDGVRLRKLSIIAPLDWPQAFCAGNGPCSAALESFMAGHVSHMMWQPHRQIVQLAEQIMAPPTAMSPEMRKLFQMSRALELICHACGTLAEDAEEEHAAMSVSTQRQCERVRDHILENLASPLSLCTIARETGASVRTIQRHFKEYAGTTVFEFIRTKRLETAYEALQRDGTSIAQAAYLAGYSNPSNFTAAFKKTYGTSPKYVRA